MRRVHVKAWLMVVCIAVLIPAVCAAGPISYMGVFPDDSHMDCDIWIPAPYVPFTAWVWILPSDNGVICAEYRVDLPPFLLTIGTTANPDHSVALGDPISGISICFAECQNDWFWTHQLNLLPTVAGIPDLISIREHPDAGDIQVANCLDGYPIEPAIVLSNLYVNQSCG